MTQADSVLSTPPTSTPIDSTRRHFLSVVAGASAAAISTLAMAAAAPNGGACTADPAFALIDAKRAADVLHVDACHVLADAESQYGVSSDEAETAFVNSGPACDAAYEAAWSLATTPPRTLVGIVAVLRFINAIDAEGNWPLDAELDRQLRATMAAAVEALLNAQAGKAVRS